MIHFDTQHEARQMVERIQKENPGSKIEEVHIDSATTHDWYLAVIAPPPYNKILYKCKYSTPILRFK